jgi:large subunit ribosomal protein L35
MPKLKTNRGAAKRFRATASGYKCRRSFRNHILTKKSTKRKRHLRTTGRIDKADMHSIDRMLPNG